MTPRVDIYAAINEERQFQKLKWPHKPGYHYAQTPGDYILLLEEYVTKAREVWSNSSKGDQACLEEIRKITAIAVCCMEYHGCPRRSKDDFAAFESPSV